MGSDLFDLTGRIAVVTGAARGLGRASAVGLAGYGADVACIDLDAGNCEDTCAEITARGRGCRAYGCDVSDQPAVAATMARIAAEFERIDILVNIAGITARVPTDRISPEQVRHLTDVNYHGTFWCCQEAGRLMLAQGGGSIVNMSAYGGGIAGIGRGNAAYCSTKGAIAALTRDLACEWAHAGIRVNAVAPSWFQTEMNASTVFADKKFIDQVMTKVPLKKIGHPAELVGPVVFLVSDAASMITGLVLPVDGGTSATCPIAAADD